MIKLSLSLWEFCIFVGDSLVENANSKVMLVIICELINFASSEVQIHVKMALPEKMSFSKNVYSKVYIFSYMNM